MSTYTPNHAGIRAMAASPAMVEAMRRKAEQMKAYAEVIAPVDTGRYKASFHVTAGVRGTTAYGRLSNNARDPRTGYPYCVALEFGNSRIHAQRILQRSIDALRAT